MHLRTWRPEPLGGLRKNIFQLTGLRFFPCWLLFFLILCFSNQVLCLKYTGAGTWDLASNKNPCYILKCLGKWFVGSLTHQNVLSVLLCITCIFYIQFPSSYSEFYSKLWLCGWKASSFWKTCFWVNIKCSYCLIINFINFSVKKWKKFSPKIE